MVTIPRDVMLDPHRRINSGAPRHVKTRLENAHTAQLRFLGLPAWMPVPGRMRDWQDDARRDNAIVADAFGRRLLRTESTAPVVSVLGFAPDSWADHDYVLRDLDVERASHTHALDNMEAVSVGVAMAGPHHDEMSCERAPDVCSEWDVVEPATDCADAHATAALDS